MWKMYNYVWFNAWQNNAISVGERLCKTGIPYLHLSCRVFGDFNYKTRAVPLRQRLLAY